LIFGCQNEWPAANHQKKVYLARTTKHTMKKLLLVLVLIITSIQTFALWQPLGSGLNGRVYALTAHNNELYAGGNFSGLISKWDGVNWVTVGAGLTGSVVRSLISFNGELYAGGIFNMQGNSGNVAKWDGTSWVAVGAGLGGVAGSGVMCMKEWNGELYAGGTFTMSGTSSLQKVARLDSSSWVQVGGVAPPNCTAGVYAMEVYNSQLYVGGEGMPPWINVLDITGSQWNNLAQGGLVSGVGVYALGAFHYPSQSFITLFIGGSFNAPPSSTCCTYLIGNWGTSLNMFSAGTTEKVNAFLSTTNYLYAGGNFTVNGMHTATNLAKKSTSAPWDTAGAVTDGPIDAFTEYLGYLVCGGNFITANGDTMNHVMINDGVFVSTNHIPEKSEAYLFPNPVHSILHYAPAFAHDIRQLKIFSAEGKEVFETEIEKECEIDLGRLNAGVYFYSISEKGVRVSGGRVVVE